MIYLKDTPLLRLDNSNYSVTAIRLNTVTDETDTLVEKSVAYVFAGKLKPMPGNIFIIGNSETNNAQIILAYAADFEVPSVYVNNLTVYLTDGGFETEILTSTVENAESTVRRHLLPNCPKKSVMMSNTWGDGNAWTRVNAEFVKNEIKAAKEIGIDAVQIDDGWQTGNTGDRSIIDENGRRKFDGDFWNLNYECFPQGLSDICDYAQLNNIELGLWFAPDFHNNFAHFDRDSAVLENSHTSFGCKYFKLDMLHIFNTEDKEKFIKMGNRLSKSGLLELDVTNGKRLGYLLSQRLGIIFMENRYTKTGNYFPYRTLKNLWELGHYIPLQSLQAEIANPALNKESYSSPLAPENYDFDYIFATVCFAQPLFWMETQFLPDSHRKQLARIMPIYKEIRESISASEITPIGEIPDGINFTGFCAVDNEYTYCVVFRENGENNEYSFTLPGEFYNCDLSASNNTASATVNGNSLNVNFSDKNTYALIRLGK